MSRANSLLMFFFGFFLLALIKLSDLNDEKKWKTTEIKEIGSSLCKDCCALSQEILRNSRLNSRENVVCFAYGGKNRKLSHKHLTKFQPVYGFYLSMAQKFLTDVFNQTDMFFHASGEVLWIIEDDCTIDAGFIKMLYDLRIPFLAHSIEKTSRSVSILVPNFHFIENDGYKHLIKQFQEENQGFSKKKSTIFWRGSDTGYPCSVPSLFGSNCSRSCKTVQRVELVKRSSRIPWIDANLTNLVQWCQSDEELRQNFVSGKISEIEWIKNRGILEIDGNVDAWGNFWRMGSGSVVYRVESPYVSSFSEKQVPHIHFIPLSANFSDLENVTRLITSTEIVDVKKLENIAENAREYCTQYSYLNEIQRVSLEIFLIWNKANIFSS